MSEGPKKFFLYINGRPVAVSEQVYREYHHYKRKEEYFSYDLKAEGFQCDQEAQTAVFTPSREDSLDRLVEADRQFVSNDELPEDAAIKADLLGQLNAALQTLSSDELRLIHELYFQGRTKRAASDALGIPFSTLKDREKAVLRKLKKFFEKSS